MDNHVVGTTHQGLSLAVLVPVVQDEVELLVRTGHQVRTHVNPPQTGAVHLVALVQVEVGGVARCIQVATVVTALDHKFKLSVAVDISHRAIVQAIAAQRGSVAVDNGFDGYFPILVVPWFTLSS